MNESAFDLGNELNSMVVRYILSNKLWNKFQINDFELNFDLWTKIKYLNERGDSFSDQINSIPNDQGGLYLFYVSCQTIKGITEFPLYIGRAQLTENQNLRKRIKTYFQKYRNNAERPKLFRMLRIWGKELRVAYIVLNSNIITVETEKKLINSLLLPMNDEIPDKKIKDAIKAFNL